MRLISEDATLCGECMINPPRFGKAICFGPYEDPLKEAIHIMKFEGIIRDTSQLNYEQGIIRVFSWRENLLPFRDF